MPNDSDELGDIKRKLKGIERKLNKLLQLQSKPPLRRDFVPATLVSLPEHLKKTALAIATMGQGMNIEQNSNS